MRRKRKFRAGDPVHFWPHKLALQPYRGMVLEVKYNRHVGFSCLVEYTDWQGLDQENWVRQDYLTHTL